MSRHHYFYPPHRRGLTLVEILIAVALMTIIMLAAIRVLSYVSSSLNQAQNAMVIAGRARTAQLQLERDLDCVTAPLTPPLRFDDAQGYFCIIEGLGSDYGKKLVHKDKDNIDKIGWSLEDIAINSETGEVDSTVGDCDDILMFTARAPADSMFRGLVGGQVMESQCAEICYFLRGTTLYRRVLLIIPDEQLQAALSDPNSNYSSGAFPARDGYGFYRDFDVSVRLEKDHSGALVIKANNLADLTRRENRYAHANQPVLASSLNPFPYSIHNSQSGAQIGVLWYHLRLPTLAECTMDEDGYSWRTGKQIVRLSLNRTLRYDDREVNSAWVDSSYESEVSTFPKGAGLPFIDYWNNPLPWNNEGALNPATQTLTAATGIYDQESTSAFQFKQRVNEDVLLTNVLSFDIKVWCPLRKEFIDLGQYKNEEQFRLTTSDVDIARKFSCDLGLQGFYGLIHRDVSNDTELCYANHGTYRYGLLPCVYDTWSDAYENDATGDVLTWATTWPPQSIEGIGVVPPAGSVGVTDIMEHVDKWRCPPPYNVPLTGIQIKIRVFDPDTKNIREVTIRRNFN